MKDISIGIYHKDHQYGKRLMEYLNHQKDFPMTASFTSDEEMFFKQEQEGDFECLVLAEETDYHGDFPVCRIGANESMGGMYCQSAKEITDRNDLFQFMVFIQIQSDRNFIKRCLLKISGKI